MMNSMETKLVGVGYNDAVYSEEAGKATDNLVFKAGATLTGLKKLVKPLFYVTLL